MLGGRARERIIDLSAICDTESKLNSNICAKYLSVTVGLYANPQSVASVSHNTFFPDL